MQAHQSMVNLPIQLYRHFPNVSSALRACAATDTQPINANADRPRPCDLANADTHAAYVRKYLTNNP
jgi:hypothetical protein